MKNNPINPLDWIQMAQNWFTRTEKSSGFRPYLIYLLLVYGLAIALLISFFNVNEIRSLAINIIYIATITFALLFAIKSFQNPDFCRSEKHIESIRRMELSEQKGDLAPQIIEMENTKISQNPTPLELPNEEKK